jgi:phosphoglycolate phosphatase-like HAD superfamily hydrolase
MGVLEGTAFLFDLDGTLGEPKNIIPRIDAAPTSPSLFCWEAAVADFLQDHQIPIGFNRHGIWSSRHKLVGTDLDRARSWLDANNIRKRLPKGSNPEPELLERMEAHYQGLTQTYGPDFRIFDEVPGALNEINLQEGRSFAWTGNTKGKTKIKIAPLLDRGLIEKDPMFTGEEPLKAGLIHAARAVLAKDFSRMIIVGDTAVDQRAYEHMINNLDDRRIGRRNMVFARRVPASSKLSPEGVSLPKPLDEFQGGIFFELGDPLFNILALGPENITQWAIDNRLSIGDLEAIDQELARFNPFKANSYNLENIRPELHQILSYIFSGKCAQDPQHYPEATRFQYNSMFWDYIFSFTVGKSLNTQLFLDMTNRQKHWAEMMECQYLFERADRLIRLRRGYSLEI